jgi:hypothetical protein
VNPGSPAPTACRSGAGGRRGGGLQFDGRTFEWSFLRADVSFAILGVDFLHANKLLVDVASNSLVDSATGDRFSLTGQPSGHTASIMLPANLPERSKPARPLVASPVGA